MKFKRNDVLAYLGDHLIQSQCTSEENATYDSAVFDSREAVPGIIFIAMDGTRSVGIIYLDDAIQRGATCIIANIKYENELKPSMEKYRDVCDFLLVDDSLYVYGILGKLSREQFSGDVIGVIGSVGKTTTKNMLRELGGGSKYTHASRGSFNNQTGVPLTLCAIDENARRAVVELGESHFGDLTYITEISLPTHLVITNVAEAHTEFLGDVLGVAKTMNETVSLMKPNSKVIVPISTKHLDVVLGATKAQVIFIDDGDSSSDFDVNKYENSKIAYVKNVTARDDQTYDFLLEYGDTKIDLHVPMVGRHFVIDAALAAVAMMESGESPDSLADRLENVVPQGHRMKMIETPSFLIIDDCYNANPASMKASMEALVAVTSKNKTRSVFIMGPMRELGKDSDRYHRELGTFANTIGIDVLVCVDEAVKPASEVGVHPHSYYFETVAKACEGIESIVQNGDSIGIKASRGGNPDYPAMVPLVEFLSELKLKD